jgi:HSP20 family protein
MSTLMERRSLLPRWADWLEVPDWFTAWNHVGADGWMRVEEHYDDDHLVICAELPGIDPDRDVEITVANGLLTIAAERREEHHDAAKGTSRSEFHYGSLRRTLRVPAGAKQSDITATYKDGILTVTVPQPAEAPTEVHKVPVSRG